MAHFAKLNDSNIVLEIHCISNDALDKNSEEISGIEFLTKWSGGHTNWKQTSYNGNFRGKYAAINDSYLPEEDIFIAPQPFPSWTRSGSYWNPPTPMPTTEGKSYYWSEYDLNWREITND
jgi:hypothetical protein